jgi:predicted GIY-YIG superfamily endonuclease
MTAVDEGPRQRVAIDALWWVYVLVAEDAPTYVGITHDVTARLERHRRGHGGRTTRRSSQWILLGALPVGSRGDAMRVERRVKRWPDAVKRLHFEKFPWLDAASQPSPAWTSLVERITHLEKARVALDAAERAVVADCALRAPHLVRFLRNQAWSEADIAAHVRYIAQHSTTLLRYDGTDELMTAYAVRGALCLDREAALKWERGRGSR